MDEEAKRKGARTQRSTRSIRRGRSASRWRLLGRAARECARNGYSGGLRFLPRLARGCGRRPPTPANRRGSLCVLASLRSVVQHRSDSCALEIQEIAALNRPLEFGAEIHGRLAGTWNAAATKPGAAMSSLAACFNPKMTHKFCRRPNKSLRTFEP